MDEHEREVRMEAVQPCVAEPAGPIIEGWLPDRVYRPAAAPQRAVVCFGGFLECGSFHFKPLAEALCQRGFLVGTFSLAGHSGTAGLPLRYDEDTLLESGRRAVRQVQAALSQEAGLILVGFSLGALLATVLAAELQCDALVLEGSYLRNSTGQREAVHQVAFAVRRLLPQAWWKALSHRMLDYRPPVLSPELITDAHRRRPFYAQLPLQSLATAVGLRRQARGVIRDRRISCPVLVAHGACDATAALTGSRWIASTLGEHARLEVFDRSPHSIARGPRCSDFTTAVCRFVTQLPPVRVTAPKGC